MKGGGLYATKVLTILIMKNVHFIENQSTEDGGAIYLVQVKI